MNEYLIMLFLAAIPISEARGAIIYGFSAGLDKGVLLVASILVNIAVVPIIFWFLNKARFKNLAYKLFGNQMREKISKHTKRFELYAEFALLIFVAVPLPVTGAWTSSLIANILHLNERKSFLVIALGVIISALVVFFSVTGIFAVNNILT